MSILRTMKVLVKKIRAALSAKLVPLVLAALLLPVLAGCGPKDIGAGSSSDGERGAPAPSPEPAIPSACSTITTARTS